MFILTWLAFIGITGQLGPHYISPLQPVSCQMGIRMMIGKRKDQRKKNMDRVAMPNPGVVPPMHVKGMVKIDVNQLPMPKNSHSLVVENLTFDIKRN